MARPKLTNEQREALLMWLAADYDTRLIKKFFEAREWPEITYELIYYYRDKHREEIDQLRQERRSRAMTTGLALKEERIERLKEHADQLEAIKWEPDEKGKLNNEKAWRETLDDIAKEMGHRRQTTTVINLTPEQAAAMTDQELEEELKKRGLL